MARRIITCTKIPERDRDTIHQLPLDSYGDIHPGPVGTQVSYGVDLDDEQFEWLLSQGPSNLIHAITVGDRGMGWTPSTIPAEYQLRDFIGDPETGIARAMEEEGETTETVDESTRTYRYWRPGPILDQGSEGACVGFSAAAFKGCDPLMSSVDDSEALRIYRRAQHLDQWPGECVDEQTQCLSRRGWLGPEELQAGDEILTFDMDGEGLRWKPVKLVHRYFSKPYRVWENNQLSIAVTDNHKWVVANRNTHGAYELVETLDLKAQHTVPRAVPSLLEQPTKPTYSDDFIRAVAWVVMEGYYRAEYRRGNGIGISQKSHKAGVAAVMERLGVARGYEDKIGVHHWELSGELATQIREIAPGKAPGIDWLRTLTRRQLRIFVDTCIQADGSEIDAGRNGRRERRVFHQKPGPILDAFLAACSMLGIAVSRSTESSEDRAAETWSLRDSSHAEVRKLTPGPYLQGPVWCPETEAGTFLARRNGSVFITGNSYSGTSVDAGCKVLREDETIEVYAWATTKAELYYWILNKGPVMLGMDWYEGMYVTDRNGFIRPTGRRVGGHAILARGRSAWKSLRLQNSWGRDFGESGYCWLSEVDLSFLMSTRVDMATSVQVRL